MILRHRDWDSEKELEKPMTVGQFVQEIVLNDENKEKKYFRISMKQAIDGKSNLIIYCQDNKVKSHHSTGIEFDYNSVIDWEILPHYSERIIRSEDIISMSLDFEPKRKHKAKTWTKEGMDKISKELSSEWERDLSEENNRKRVFNNNVTQDDLITCIRQLIEDLQKQKLANTNLEQRINECKEREENLQQQIKWLEYRLNNKL